MRFIINTDFRDRGNHYTSREFPVALLLTAEDYRRLKCEADYTGSIQRCPKLAELLDAAEEFEAGLHPSPQALASSPLPLVRTGPGGCYTKDYTPGQLDAATAVQAVGELNVTV